MRKVGVNIFWGNLRPVLGNLWDFWKKKNDLLYTIQCSYQALRYIIVYIDENCLAADIFNNLGI